MTKKKKLVRFNNKESCTLNITPKISTEIYKNLKFNHSQTLKLRRSRPLTSWHRFVSGISEEKAAEVVGHTTGSWWTTPSHFNTSHSFQVFVCIPSSQRSLYTSAHSLSSSDDATCTAEGIAFQLNISLHSLSSSQNFLPVY